MGVGVGNNILGNMCKATNKHKKGLTALFPACGLSG